MTFKVTSLKSLLLVILLPLYLLANPTRPIFSKQKIQVGSKTLTVEVAKTPEESAYGLMFKRKLGETDGMLFIFSKEQPLSFWMKNTLIPLDIIFIGRSGTVMRIAEKTAPLSLTPIDSGSTSYTVIEIDGGRAAREGIRVGDRVSFQFQEDTLVR